MRPALPGLPGSPGAGWSWAVCGRWAYQKTEIILRLNAIGRPNVDRREFVALTAAGLASSLLKPLLRTVAAEEAAKSKIKAIAFDAFPIFDPRPVIALAEELFPGKGAALSDEWRIRQFEYTWLRLASRHYADFWQITQDAL